MASISSDLLTMLAQAAPVETPSVFQRTLSALWNFFYVGGWFMIPIVLCSFVALLAVIWKCIELRRSGVISSELEHSLETLTVASLPATTEQIRNDTTTLGEICRQAVFVDHDSREDAERCTESLAREKIFRLERGIPALEMIFTVAPLLGLIGTVSGLVTIFGTFGTKVGGPQQAQFIAKGISEALNCTIAGLAVAVPSYMFQSYFSRKLETLALRMGTLTTNLINTAYRMIPQSGSAVPVAGPKPVAAVASASTAASEKSKFQVHPEPTSAEG